MKLAKIRDKKELRREMERANGRIAQMKAEYSSFQDHYQELSEFIEPRRGRFLSGDVNDGRKRHKNILNNHGSMALRKATAGMLAGVASPSRPWFSLTLFDKDIASNHEVRIWLDDLRKIVLAVLAASNFYNMAPILLKELLLFGTGCMTHVDDYEDVARFYTHTAGSYLISANERGNIDTLCRRFRMTVYQMVQRFGLDNVSRTVKDDYDKGNYGFWHTVVHLIEPNADADFERGRLSAEAWPYISLYWEDGKTASDAPFLKREGFRDFPAYCPRWETTNEDVYGTNCPGMISLADIKQLQAQEKELARGLAKTVNPPLQGPSSMRNKPVQNLPGSMTTTTMTGQKIEPIYNLRLDFPGMLGSIQAVERRISTGFYVDLFMAITDMQGIQPKNEMQLSHINQERLLQIGPVLEQIHGEWLARMVSRTVQQVLDADIMPPAPEILQGHELDIEFVSALAMAQKSIAIGAIERTAMFAGSLSQGGWDTRAVVDADFALREYGGLVGAPPAMFKSETETAEERQAEQQQAQQAAMMQQAQQMANVGKMAADAKLDGDSVLSRAVENQQEGA